MYIHTLIKRKMCLIMSITLWLLINYISLFLIFHVTLLKIQVQVFVPGSYISWTQDLLAIVV